MHVDLFHNVTFDLLLNGSNRLERRKYYEVRKFLLRLTANLQRGYFSYVFSVICDDLKHLFDYSVISV